MLYVNECNDTALFSPMFYFYLGVVAGVLRLDVGCDGLDTHVLVQLSLGHLSHQGFPRTRESAGVVRGRRGGVKQKGKKQNARDGTKKATLQDKLQQAHARLPGIPYDRNCCAQSQSCLFEHNC